MNAGLFTSDRPDWETPPDLIADLEAEFGPFDLDPCCWPHTAKAPRFYTPAEDGLSQPWFGRVFVNPPYGREISQWVAKANRERERTERIVLLLPARTDTAWWHDHVINHQVRFLRGRVKFWLDGEPKMSAPFPSAVVVMDGGQSEKPRSDGQESGRGSTGSQGGLQPPVRRASGAQSTGSQS